MTGDAGSGGARVGALVLAGGRSSRFGRDKLAEPLDGRPLLEHALAAARAALASMDAGAEVVVVLGPDTVRDLPSGVAIVHDQTAFEGPLAGLATGLRGLDPAVELVLLVAGDMPRLVPAVLRLLLTELDAQPAVGVVLLEDIPATPVGSDPPPSRGGRPLPAALRRAPALAAAEALLAAGERRLLAIADRLPTAVVPGTAWMALDPTGLGVRDVDVPADMALVGDASGRGEARASTLQAIADAIVALRPGLRVIVAIDGVDGAGKSTFADELAARIRERRPVVRATEDRFHRPSVERYARGRHSPEGFYRDSYDDDALRARLLDPFAAGAPVVTGVFDHHADEPRLDPPIEPPSDAVLLLDGLFLHRPALAGAWSASVFLDVTTEVGVRRCAERDGSDPDPGAAANRRYVEGQALYLAEVGPRRLATWVVDNDDPAHAWITRGPEPGAASGMG